MIVVPKTKILVVDDDRSFLHQIQPYLERLGYEVDTAENGIAALALVQVMSPDLVVLDIHFPDSKNGRVRSIDGVEVLRRLRKSGTVPVLMLSATTITAVKVMALSIGANDYVSKPVGLQELVTRIEAILCKRGTALPKDSILGFRRLRLDPGERRVWKDGALIELTGIEFDLLYALARCPEHPFTRDKLIELVAKSEGGRFPKAVAIHIGHLRKKIEDDPTHPTFIITVRGTGYRFEDSAA